KEPMAPPPPMVLPWTWTGAYGGVNIGTGWGYGSATAFDNATGAVLGTATSNTGGAFRGGGQIGYLYQFPGNFVIGGQLNVEGIQGRTRTNQVFGITTSDRIALGLTGQLGYAFGDFLPFI